MALQGLWCVAFFAPRFVTVHIIHPQARPGVPGSTQRRELFNGNPLHYSYCQTRGTHYRVVCYMYIWSMQNEERAEDTKVVSECRKGFKSALYMIALCVKGYVCRVCKKVGWLNSFQQWSDLQCSIKSIILSNSFFHLILNITPTNLNAPVKGWYIHPHPRRKQHNF